MTAVDVDALDKLREVLVTASTAVGDMAEDWWCPKREGVRRTECRYCIAEFAADALLPVVDRIATERAAAARVEAMNDVLHWLSEDVTWAGPVLGNDVALGIDHARRRVVEMRAGRWPVATAEDPA